MNNFHNYNRRVYVILYNGDVHEIWDDALMAENRLRELQKRLKQRTTFRRRLFCAIIGQKDNLWIEDYMVHPTGEF